MISNEEQTHSPKREKRSSLEIFATAIHALFMRELITRFGHYRLGYLWVVFEPALHLGFMLILFGAIMKHTIPGMSYSLFLVAGMLPWFMFSNSMSRALGAVDGNRGLFHYKIIRPIDTIFARVALELFIYFSSLLVFLLLFLLIGIEISFSQIPLMLWCWVSLSVLSIAVSLIMMVVGSFSPELDKVVSAVMRVLYFASGILYSVHSIPDAYQGYILWNPVVHVMEYMRYSLAPSYPMGHVSMVYFWECTLVLLLVGLMFYRARERAMLTTS